MLFDALELLTCSRQKLVWVASVSLCNGKMVVFVSIEKIPQKISFENSVEF